MSEYSDNQLELANAIRQVDFVVDVIKKYTSTPGIKFKLTPELIRQLHELAFTGIDERVGTFRDIEIHVEGSEHRPPPASDISNEVKSLCGYVNDHWDRDAPLHLAAFVLWKLNWIHPFSDGNGRTARALSYIVLSIGFGGVLPGTQTIVEQIRNRRAEFFDALAAADKAFQSSKKIDVSVLESMLEEMLRRQLGSVLTLPEDVESRLTKILRQRIYEARPQFLQVVYGSTKPAERIWTVADYAILQLAPAEDIQRAADRQDEFGDPFPRLIAPSQQHAKQEVAVRGPTVLPDPFEMDVGDAHALFLAPDAAAIIARPHIVWSAESSSQKRWNSAGALYIVRLGNITSDDLAKAFDAAIAKHLTISG